MGKTRFWMEKIKRKKRSKKSSSSTNNTTGNRSPVSAISGIPTGIKDIEIPDPTGDIINRLPTGLGGGAGEEGEINIPSGLKFGELNIKSGDNGSGLLSRNTKLGNDPGTIRSLKQIAEVLLLDPKIKMRITFYDPKKPGSNFNKINQSEITKWNKKKFQVLARYLQKNFGINPGRLSYSQEGVGGNLILKDFKIEIFINFSTNCLLLYSRIFLFSSS